MRKQLSRGLIISVALAIVLSASARAQLAYAQAQLDFSIEFSPNANLQFTFSDPGYDWFRTGFGTHAETHSLIAGWSGTRFSNSIFTSAHASFPPESYSASFVTNKPVPFLTITNTSNSFQATQMELAWQAAILLFVAGPRDYAAASWDYQLEVSGHDAILFDITFLESGLYDDSHAYVWGFDPGGSITFTHDPFSVGAVAYAVPEPSTLAFVAALGMVLITGRFLRRRSK